jgi:hypothetical protein
VREECDRRLANVCYPISFIDGRLGEIFSKYGSRKSINWFKYATIFYKFHLLNTLELEILEPFHHLFQSINNITKIKLNKNEIENYYQELIQSICEIEGSLPYSECTFLLHELTHICYYIKQFGPVRSFHMFGFERFNRFMKSLSSNPNNPHISMIKTYMVKYLIIL